MIHHHKSFPNIVNDMVSSEGQGEYEVMLCCFSTPELTAQVSAALNDMSQEAYGAQLLCIIWSQCYFACSM